jgi:thioredoxin 1
MNNFEGHINGDKPVLVDFFADWCVPCKLMTPILQQLKQHLGDRITILKMDIDKNPALAESYHVHSVPSLVLFKNGTVLWRKSGFASATEVMEHLKYHLPN